MNISEREREVMALVAEGKPDSDIADRLYISESTVKFHVRVLAMKLPGEGKARVKITRYFYQTAA